MKISCFCFGFWVVVSLFCVNFVSVIVTSFEKRREEKRREEKKRKEEARKKGRAK